MTPRDFRLRYVAEMMRRGRALGHVPRYGSPEWRSLSGTDPRFVAAIVRAAECWFIECDRNHIAERLQDELAVERQIQSAREAQEFAAVAQRVRQRADTPTWAKIRERWGVTA